MTFIDFNTNKTHQNWIEYYKVLGKEIPEGKLGVNPGQLSRSKIINIVYSYY
jgi:hypothetical protein